MNNPFIVAISAFALVIGISLLVRWYQQSRKPSKQIFPDDTVGECSFKDTALGETKPPAENKKEDGLGKIRQADPLFDENMFKDHVSAFYFQFLAARSQHHIDELRQQMTEEMYAVLKAEDNRLAAEGKINKIENVALNTVELADAWQQNGHDFIKVKYLSEFMKYCIEEKPEDEGCNFEGEKIDYAKHWIFSRISGRNPWYLFAIESW